MNMRNCGDTDALTPTLYHSGLSGDVGAVVEHFAGKLRPGAGSAGRLLHGRQPGAQARRRMGQAAAALSAVATVCPAIDLAAGADALHEPANRLYERHFLRGLMRRFRRKAALFPAIYETEGIWSGALHPRVRRQDRRALLRLPRCRRLLLPRGQRPRRRPHRRSHARSQPRRTIRSSACCLRRALAARPIPISTFVETRHGGHCAFLCGGRGRRYSLGRSHRHPLPVCTCPARPMEADWELEIGGGAPRDRGRWPGFVDLRACPHRVDEISRNRFLCRQCRLRLLALNETTSPVWTSKCDVWPVAEFDPDELDAPSAAALCAVAVYIDLLARETEQWTTPYDARDWCQARCLYLRAVPLRCCRADFVIRHAVTHTQESSVGITAYLTACGATRADADSRLGAALNALAEAVGQAGTPVRISSKLQ